MDKFAEKSPTHEHRNIECACLNFVLHQLLLNHTSELFIPSFCRSAVAASRFMALPSLCSMRMGDSRYYLLSFFTSSMLLTNFITAINVISFPSYSRIKKARSKTELQDSKTAAQQISLACKAFFFKKSLHVDIYS